MDDLTTLTGTEIVRRLTDGSTTVEAIAVACLSRIAARDPLLRAWVHVDPELVLASARALDQLPRAARGPLHGVPIGVKDIILTADQPTQYNSPLYQGHHPRMDAACIQTLRAAGALIVGKTDTVEFGATGRRALTCNPRDLARTPGGSSSGSAAAVADGHVPIALGTQTGGSMIRPASFCGAWGFKPTWGIASNEGVRRYAASLDTLGWFARSGADLTLIHDVFDTDPRTIEDAPDFAQARVGVYRTSAWGRATVATSDALSNAIETLRASGTTVEELVVPPDFERLVEFQRLMMRSEARASLLAESRVFPGRLDGSLLEQAENADRTTRAQLLEAYDIAASCRRAFDRIAAAFDAVLAPSAVGIAPRGLTDTGDYVFNGVWTLLHVPCVNVPGWSSDEGMPVGLTITGARYADRKVLRFAEAFGRLVDRSRGNAEARRAVLTSA